MRAITNTSYFFNRTVNENCSQFVKGSLFFIAGQWPIVDLKVALLFLITVKQFI